MNRKQFWLRYVGAFALYFVALVCIDALIGGEDWLVDLVAQLALVAANLRLLYLRAVDVGYSKPGSMTAGRLIPLVGLYFFFNIGFRPTGWAHRQPSLALAAA